MTISHCEELARAFADALTERARLYAEGKIRQSNKLFERSRAIATEMMADRDAREQVFKRLMTHPSEDVVVSAACYLLPIDEPFAIGALLTIDQSGTRPENQLTAHYAVKEWKAGQMHDIRVLA